MGDFGLILPVHNFHNRLRRLYISSQGGRINVRINVFSTNGIKKGRVTVTNVMHISQDIRDSSIKIKRFHEAHFERFRIVFFFQPEVFTKKGFSKVIVQFLVFSL
jgi:hypothetical protein